MHQVIQRREGFLQRRHEIEAVDNVEVDVVGAQTLETVLAALDDVVPAQAHVVDICAHATAHLGGQHHMVALALQCLAENFLRLAVRIDIGRIEKVDAAVDCDIHEALRCRLVESTDDFPVTLGAKRHRAEAQLRYQQSRFTKLTILHDLSPSASTFLCP
jgi:hypothetical protein